MKTLKGLGLRRYWIVRQLLSLPRPRTATANGHLMFLDRLDFTVSAQLAAGSYEPFETEILKSLIKPSDTVIDLGANIGYYATLFSSLAFLGKVFAFEPSPRAFTFLRRNTQDCNNVEIFQIAIGDKRGTVRLYHNQYNHGDNRIFPSFNDEGTDVIINTLDNLIDEKVDVIKIDIQGAEVKALKGMENLLIKWHPIIVTEFDPHLLRGAGDEPEHLIDFLTNLGYRFQLINENTHVVLPIAPSELIKTYSKEGMLNLICRT